MIVHENVELMSSFVDGELEPPLRRAVEEHLADCPPCRERIGGLRRLVEELQALEVVAPPAGLSSRVRQAVLFDEKRGGGLRRSAEALRRWTDQPLLLPLFGVVTALAVLLYLFSAWSGGAGRATRLVVGAPDDTSAAVALEGAVAESGGRIFDHVGERWVERGVDAGGVLLVLELPSPRPEHAALEPFRPLGGRVVLRYGEEAVEVVFGPGAD